MRKNTTTQHLNDERNSIFFWFPRIERHPSVPLTELIRISEDTSSWKEKGIPKETLRMLKGKIIDFGKRLKKKNADVTDVVFIRGDKVADKFNFRRSCRLEINPKRYPNGKAFEDAVAERFLNTVAYHEAKGLELKGFAIREYIVIDPWFQTYGGLPIGTEVRVVVNEGRSEEWFPIWTYDVVKGNCEEEEAKRKLWELGSFLVAKESIFLPLAEEVYRYGRFKGRWTIDLAMDNWEDWWVIDMSPAEISWKPADRFFIFEAGWKGRGTKALVA